jgi:hypothetical protein
LGASAVGGALEGHHGVCELELGHAPAEEVVRVRAVRAHVGQLREVVDHGRRVGAVGEIGVAPVADDAGHPAPVVASAIRPVSDQDWASGRD